MSGAVDIAATIAFLGFFAGSFKKVKSTVQESLQAYRKNIANILDEATASQIGAKNQLDLSRQTYGSLEARKEDILNLARQEANFILDSMEQTIEQQKKGYHLNLHNQQSTIRAQAQKELITHVIEHMKEIFLTLAEEQSSDLEKDFFSYSLKGAHQNAKTSA